MRARRLEKQMRGVVEEFVTWANRTDVEPLGMAGYWRMDGDDWARVDTTDEEQERLYDNVNDDTMFASGFTSIEKAPSRQIRGAASAAR